ncbi:UNVERIFIED_CONTAM: hypothetical protein FKN15_050734 [Acipenser sinensis]
MYRNIPKDMDGDKNQFQQLIQSLKRRRALTLEERGILLVEGLEVMGAMEEDLLDEELLPQPSTSTARF